MRAAGTHYELIQAPRGVKDVISEDENEIDTMTDNVTQVLQFFPGLAKIREVSAIFIMRMSASNHLDVTVDER